MRLINKGDTFDMYYRPDVRTSGLTVVFDVWDEDGTLQADNIAASEIGTRGIYTAQHTAPNADIYLLIRGAESTNDDYPYAPFVVQVGQPTTRKLFYADPFFEAGQSLVYRIFDLNDTELQSGTLTDIGNGFYSVDVSVLSGDYYFRVYPLAEVVHN